MRGEARLIETWGKHNPEFGSALPFADKWKVERQKKTKSNKRRSNRGVFLGNDGRVHKTK